MLCRGHQKLSVKNDKGKLEIVRAISVSVMSAALLLADSVAFAYETPTQECVNVTAEVNDVEKLRGRAPIRVRDQTFSTLTNSTRASADDRVEIRRWAEVVEQCHRRLANETSKTLTLRENQILERDHTQFLILLAELYDGNITFGNFAKRRAELNLLTSSQITAISEARQRVDDQRPPQGSQDSSQTLGRLLSPGQGYIPMQPYNIPAQPYLAPLAPTTTCYTNSVGHTRCNTW
jgi:hypothetical protein